MGRPKVVSRYGPEKQEQRIRTHQGQKVKPCLYVAFGGKRKMCAVIEATGDLVCDENGKPLPWQSVGS
tara:strand:+ start:161 stop:364 length:204 start_codon:yes stop_codon:yes gene_type:complete